MRDAAKFILERRAITLAVIISLVTAIGLLALYVLKDRFGTDFGMYWRVANEPLSMAYIPRDDLPFPYLPTMMLWIQPLSFVPLWPAYFVWVIFSAVLFGVVSLRYLSGPATLLALFSPPLIGCYLTGQVSAVLAVALLWAFGTSNRIGAGIVLAVIASIKPQFVIMAPLILLLKGDWRAILASAISFLLILTTSLAAYGLDTWFVWFASLDDFHGMVVAEQVMSVGVTPAGAADYWGLPSTPFLILGAALGAWLVFQCRNQSPLALSAAVGCGSLLAAPYALVHDLAVVVPYLAWSIFQGRLTAAVAISGAAHPLPLILTTIGLAKFDRSGQPADKVSTPGTPNND